MAGLAPWWNQRSAREQLLLALAAGLLALLLAWLLILRPLAGARAAAIDDARTAQAQLAQVRALAAAIRARPAPPAGPVHELIGRRLAEAGLSPARLEAQGPGQAVIEIAAINGRLLIGWAAALEQRDGLVVEELEANRNSDQSVRARLLIRKAG
ncbi:MAG: type II secretion system protein M [Alphaproteobacteria bacterium]|nr:type II secretion system protein M [Alphaproteobacteria bacterium]